MRFRVNDDRFIKCTIALALLAASAITRAGLVPVPMAAAVWPEPEPGLGLAARPLAASWAIPLATPLAATSLGADASGRESLAAAGTAVPAGGASGLWIFITSVRAQQRGDTFTLLQSNLGLNAPQPPPASQVPLPAAGWLLALGLIGLAGVRWAAQRGLVTAGPALPRGLRPLP